MTTINDISDLIRILREQPEWAEALRGVLLSRELLELPDRFAEFVELTTRNFQLVNERLDRLETDVDQLKTDLSEFKASVDERFNQVDERFNQVDERFNQVDERFNQVDERFNKVDERFNRVDERFDGIDRRLDRMEGRMDNGFGTNYEIKVEKNLPSHVGQSLGLRNVRVLRGIMTGRDPILEEQTERAVEEGLITWEQHDQLWLADLIFTGRSRTGGPTVHALAEVSITAGDVDPDRAVERARILSIVIRQPATPVVISANVDDERARRARDRSVTVILAPQ